MGVFTNTLHRKKINKKKEEKDKKEIKRDRFDAPVCVGVKVESGFVNAASSPDTAHEHVPIQQHIRDA